MKEGRASTTAERVAGRRAAHQLIDKPVVFDDPLALRIATPELTRESSSIGRYLRASIVVRSRFTEDELQRAVTRGMRQYVILGAGLDTFAYRNPYEELRVIEVDHIATQEMKRRRLAEAQIAVPPQTVYLPIDFATTSIDTALAASIFDSTTPAFFSWLGVIPYLDLPAIESTLRFIGSLPTGTTIVFDYGTPPSSLGYAARMVFEYLSSRVAAVGEPWKTFFEPGDLEALLRRTGFAKIENLGPGDINARYFAGRTDDLRVGEMLHIAKAVV